MPLSDQQLQEMVRQAQAGNMSKQGQAMPGVPTPMPGAQQNQIPGGPQQIAAGATNIGDSGAQQEAMLQRLMQSQGQQQPQGFANGGYVAPQDSDIFQNSSRALVRAAMGRSRDGGDNEEDGLTGDEMENLTRGGSMQGEKMPGYAKGGNVDEDVFARVHDALNRSDVRPYYQNYGISPDDIVDKTLWGSNDTLGNLRAKQDGATPQLSHPKDPAYCGGGKVAYSDGGTTEMAATEDKQDDRVGRMAKNHFMRKLAGFDDGGQTDFRGGGMIPGEAPFPGDNQMNDIVKASLGPGEGEIRMSPGEEVIPRSIMGKTNAPKLAAAKVRKDMMKKSPKMLA